MTYRVGSELHEIGNANDTIARRSKYRITFSVLNDMQCPAVMLIAVKLDNQPVSFAPEIRTEPSRKCGHLGVCNNFRIKPLAQKPPQGTFIQISRLRSVSHGSHL